MLASTTRRSLSFFSFSLLAPLALACSPSGPDGAGVASGGSPQMDGVGGTGAVDGSGSSPGDLGGTGGAPAQASGGATSTGGTTADPSDPCGGADIFCETFETLAPDAIPSGGTWRARNGECSNYYGASALPAPRSGSQQALKSTDSIYAGCRLATSFEAPNDYWLRSYIYWDSDVDFSGKELMALELLPEAAVTEAKDDPAVRFGSRTKPPCQANGGAQVTIIGFGEEVTGCDASQPIPQGRWFCFEAHIQQGATLSVETFIDSTQISFGTDDTDRPMTSSMETTGAAPINHLRMGLHATAGGVKGNVYIDDVGIGTQRLGCAP